jgi:hypothetical protein
LINLNLTTIVAEIHHKHRKNNKTYKLQATKHEQVETINTKNLQCMARKQNIQTRKEGERVPELVKLFSY